MRWPDGSGFSETVHIVDFSESSCLLRISFQETILVVVKSLLAEQNRQMKGHCAPHPRTPRILIGDNLSSFLSMTVIEACQELDIRLVLLPSNSTHLCRPFDVAQLEPSSSLGAKCWRSGIQNLPHRSRRPGSRNCSIRP